jgi:protein SCO1
MKFSYTTSIIWSLGLAACLSNPKKLPYLGEADPDIPGSKYQIPPFSLINQNGDTVSEREVDGKIYIADFFFTHCPTICPKMAQQMLRIHNTYQDHPDVLFLSHSIDFKYDTIETLQKYAQKLGVADSKTWHFLRVPQDQLTSLARSYLTAVVKDSTESVGFTHSGHFVLVDQNRHIRSFCDGTKADEVDRLMKDLESLRNEMH